MTMTTRIIHETTTKLDHLYLVLNLVEYDDGACRAEVVLNLTGKVEDLAKGTLVLLQHQSSVELAVAAIARDFSTFAARTLASLPTIGALADPDDAEAEADV